MRQTAKYSAALKLAGRLGCDLDFDDQAQLYEWLAYRKYAWFPTSGEWTKTTRPVDSSGRERISIFTDDEDLPTDVVRLRLMSHPQTMERFLEIVQEAIDTYAVRIDEVSDPIPNRKGPGVRVYMTCILPPPKPEQSSDDT